jgi:hypothetical protein
MKLCEKCGKNPATLPDRNRMGRPIKRICSECHSGLLRGDLERVLNNMKKVMAEKTPEQILSDYETYMDNIETQRLKPPFKKMKIGDVPVKE